MAVTNGASPQAPELPAGASFFDIGEIRVARDSDYDYFRYLVESREGWIEKHNKNGVTVWLKTNDKSPIKMAKVCGEFKGVTAGTMFDTILDGDYRRAWDDHVLEDFEICRLDDNNDIGYYGMRCPGPLSNRDFVNQRSWKAFDNDEYIVFNHSVSHEEVPLKKKFIRGLSYMTGFLLKGTPDGCEVSYITQSDPRGKIPKWIINMAAKQVAPKVFTVLYDAASKYPEWKSANNPDFMPWRHPEQNTVKLVDPAALSNSVPLVSAINPDEDEKLTDEAPDGMATQLAAEEGLAENGDEEKTPGLNQDQQLATV